MSSSSAAKAALRKEMKNCLKSLSPDSRIQQSRDITEKLLKMKEYRNSKRIGVYLSLPEEVQTENLLKSVFLLKKDCFIPWYDRDIMKMVKLFSLDDLQSMPKTKWNISQPLTVEDREDAFENEGLDLILIPGLAFTISGRRLGRGKGYYDKYLNSMKNYRETSGKTLTTIALAFKEQIADDVPVTETDYIVDYVIYAD